MHAEAADPITGKPTKLPPRKVVAFRCSVVPGGGMDKMTIKDGA